MIGNVLYFWQYVLEGTIQCSGFNFIQDLPHLLVLFLAIQCFQDQHWGLNPNRDPNVGPWPKFHKMILGDKKGEKIDVTLELSDEEWVMHYGLNGRATNLFSVKSEKLSDQGNNQVVKVFWAEVTRMSEPDILQRLYNIGKDDALVNGHVPDIL